AEAGPEQGAGLGLPLARGLTEAMGGQLTLESGPGTGTTAAVSLPSLERGGLASLSAAHPAGTELPGDSAGARGQMTDKPRDH
ncbi:MAG TPA: ATP-binding protein, partial [Streptosporangiaceae bacterium]